MKYSFCPLCEKIFLPHTLFPALVRGAFLSDMLVPHPRHLIPADGDLDLIPTAPTPAAGRAGALRPRQTAARRVVSG